MIKVYYCVLLIVFIVSHIGINDKYSSKFISKFSAVTVFIILVFVAGFRSPYSIGDTPFYAYTYRLLASGEANLGYKDYGFTLLMKLLTGISKDPQLLIFVTSFITNLFIVIGLYKYGKPFDMGIFLYFTTMSYYVTMNGIRQSMVAAILFWAVKYVINNQWKKYFALVLLLSAFHGSAIIFIPLYFLVRKQTWNKTFWITLVAALCIALALRPMLGGIAKVLENTFYSNYGQDMLTSNLTVNKLRVLVTAVPLVLAYFVRDRMKEDWPEGDVFVYMSLLNFIFMLFSTRYLYFYRLCIYFELFNMVLLPRLLFYFEERKRLALCVYMMVLYILFSGYQVIGWNDYYRNILIL